MSVRAAVERAGGLCTATDLAARWGVSRQAVDQVKRRPGFPAPIRTAGGMELYPAVEADDFRRRMRLRLHGAARARAAQDA